MRIGLTGGTGFIGQYLIRDYGNELEFIAASSKRYFDGYQKGAEYCSTDFSAQSLSEIFSGCDAIIHLASKIPQQVTGLDSIEPYLGNILMAESVFRAGVNNNIKNVVNISSVSVYDKTDSKPYREDDAANPSNAYGITKLATEKLANLFNTEYDMRIKSLRVSQVLGFQTNHGNGFYSMLLNNARDGKPLTVYGMGKASRDYVYVKDVTEAIIRSVYLHELKGCYNISMGKSTSNTDLANAYAKVFDNRSLVVHIPTENEDDRYWLIDISKAKMELGFIPRYDVLDMVTDIKREMERNER